MTYMWGSRQVSVVIAMSIGVFVASFLVHPVAMAQEPIALNKPPRKFDGREVVTLSNLELDQVFSISLWVKPAAQQPDWAAIVDYRHSGTKSFAFHQKADDVNRYAFGIHSKVAAIGAYVSLLADQWQHVALVKSTEAMAVFVNGTRVDMVAVDQSFRIGYEGDEILTLGGWGYGNRRWLGSMSCVAVYSYPLTEAAISTLSQQIECGR